MDFNKLSSAVIEEMKISLSGVSLKYFGKKKDMKLEYKLLNDIMAISLTAKAGTFNGFNIESLEKMIAITVGVKVNYFVFLFNILIAVISTPEKQHHGLTVPIYRLLEKCRAQIGQSSVLNYHKVLNEKPIFFTNPGILSLMEIY